MEYKIMRSSSVNASFLIGLILVTSLFANPALAGDKKDKASRRAQQMVQQIQQEKAELQSRLDQETQAKAMLEADMAKAKEENTALKAKLTMANRTIDTLQTGLKEMTAERLAFEAKLMKTQIELDATKTALSDSDNKYKTALYDIKVKELQRTSLTASLMQKSKLIDGCVAKNAKLYYYGLELVKLYENPSRYKKLVLTEPFSQLKRVELENILQEYNDKIDEQKIETPK